MLGLNERTARLCAEYRLPLDPGRWAITAVAVLLAAAMRFFISFTTGLLAFWTTRATAIMELHAGVSLFLAGRIAPLALLPPAVAAVQVTSKVSPDSRRARRSMRYAVR